jgi:hypothetical protein
MISWRFYREYADELYFLEDIMSTWEIGELRRNKYFIPIWKFNQIFILERADNPLEKIDYFENRIIDFSWD